MTTTLMGGGAAARLGLGAMRLSGRDRPHDIALLRRAVELGVRHVDTARMYGAGKNEALVGEALRPFGDDVLVATKGGVELVGDGFRHDGSPAALHRHVDESLRQLRRDRISLYYLHDPDPTVPIAESVAALAQLRHAGKIALIGISNVTAGQLAEALATTEIAAVQNRYSAFDGGDDAVLDATTPLGIAFVPWGPLRGSPRGPNDPVWALRTLLGRAPNVMPIPGTTSFAHLEQNMTALTIT